MDNSKEILLQSFKESFEEEADRFFIAPGRLEIVGNHTDHNHGFALVASATLYIKSAAKKRNDGIINLNSQGSKFYNIPAVISEPNEKEYCTTNALIKGVVSGFIKRGYKVGGFDAYCRSEVPTGGGVSSSAAFECLICAILNGLYNDNKVSKLDIAKISQEAERDYFGKPCGILDQIGCAYGGISFVDFKDPSNPIIKNTVFPFDLKIVLVNPGGSHSGLTDYYASIPNDMYLAAKKCGKEYLRDVSLDEFREYVFNNVGELSLEQMGRAFHFFMENKRVQSAYLSLINKDEEQFLKMINQSGLSSSKILGNTLVQGRYKNSPERALKHARNVAPHSAHRVHGGGFMGTIICFVKKEDYPDLVKEMHRIFGPKSIIDVAISPFGAVEF